jgi:hypothetical protein
MNMEIIDTAFCTKCREEKLTEEFAWRDKAKGTLSVWCRKCNSAYGRRHYAIPVIKQAKSEYSQMHNAIPEVIKANSERAKKHNSIPAVKKANSERGKLYRQIPEVKIARSVRARKPEAKEAQSRRNQIPEIKARTNERRRQQRKTDIQFKIKCNLRTRLWAALKGNFKSGSAVRDCDCTMDWLQGWLEMQWEDWMSWENYGNKLGQWSIDHIIPLSSVDLTDRDQLVRVCHWTNLQPMRHLDNIKKGNKVTKRNITCP